MPMPHSPAPDILDFDRFMAAVDLSQTEICRALYRANPQMIRIKKERVAVRNLARLIDATLHLANRRGFAAMSMRALCQEAGLSMGGLYALIQSKDDLVGLIQSHGFMLTRQILGDFTHGITEPLARLDAAGLLSTSADVEDLTVTAVEDGKIAAESIHATLAG